MLINMKTTRGEIVTKEKDFLLFIHSFIHSSGRHITYSSDYVIGFLRILIVFMRSCCHVSVPTGDPREIGGGGGGGGHAS